MALEIVKEPKYTGHLWQRYMRKNDLSMQSEAVLWHYYIAGA